MGYTPNIPLSPTTLQSERVANAHYVAVMATMPPAAPARAWIAESLMLLVQLYTVCLGASLLPGGWRAEGSW